MRTCKRQEGWDYESRYKAEDDRPYLIDGDVFPVDYDSRVPSINGAHYHFWLPRDWDPKECLSRLVREAQRRWDVVSCSWDYVPAWVTAMLTCGLCGHRWCGVWPSDMTGLPQCPHCLQQSAYTVTDDGREPLEICKEIREE